MKPRTTFAILASWLAISVVSPLNAQSSTAPDSASNDSDKKKDADATVALSPFEVVSDRDYGYRAANSVTATRMALSIQDTPFSVSVVTGEFIRDIAGDDNLTSALRYISSVQGETRNDGASRGVFGVGNGTIRGFPVDALLRNGVYRRGGFSVASLERIEVLKGPVSVLFGSAQPGGTINYITKRPVFRRQARLTTQVQDYMSKWATDENSTSGYQAEFEYNNHYQDKLAYRVYVRTGDRNGWHDHEDFRTLTVQPAATYKPYKWLTITSEYELVKNNTNQAGAAANGNPQFAIDYANPPADVLAFHNLTAAQYRNDIFANSNAWVNLTLQARDGARAVGTTPANAFTTGRTLLANNLWRNSGLGYAVTPSHLPTGRPSFNFQGRGHYVDTLNHSVSNEVVLEPARWVKARYVHSYSFNIFTSIHTFRSEMNGPYTYGMATGNGGRSLSSDTNQQIDLLFNVSTGRIRHTAIAGIDTFRHGGKGRGAVFDYATAPAVVVDPAKIRPSVVLGPGNTLSGTNAINNWDPLQHGEVPDSSKYFVRWGNISRSDVRSTGRYAQYQAETTLAGHKVIASGGFRRENIKVNTFAPRYSSGDSKMVGLTVGLTNWLNVYASRSQNYRPNAPGFPGGGLSAEGPGLNRDVNGLLIAGANEDSALPDQTGEGTEFGFKVSTLDGVWSGGVSWFRIDRADIRVQDNNRTVLDPRNRFDSLYPQRFFADDSPDLTTLRAVDAGFVPVRFFTTTGNNRNEGVEVEGIWTPRRNFQLLVSISNIYKSKQLNTSLVGAERDILLNRRLALSPEYQGSFFGKYTFANGRLKGASIGGGLRGQTESIPRYDVYGDATDFHKSFVVADLNLRWPVRAFERDSSLTLNVTNVADKLYSFGNFAYADPRRVILRFQIEL